MCVSAVCMCVCVYEWVCTCVSQSMSGYEYEWEMHMCVRMHIMHMCAICCYHPHLHVDEGILWFPWYGECPLEK